MLVGSLGDKFYLILQGTVSAWVPNDQYKQKISMLVR
jgi:CRP-like cAMP-binding protein